MSEETTQFEMKLEVVPVPVSDVERAIDFYVNKVGFKLDHDVSPSPEFRVVQLTPHGSGCSIVIGKGMPEISDMVPGSIKALHLVVKDIEAVRNALIGRGVDVGAVEDHGRGVKYARFEDPDGNSWLLQTLPY